MTQHLVSHSACLCPRQGAIHMGYEFLYEFLYTTWFIYTWPIHTWHHTLLPTAHALSSTAHAHAQKISFVWEMTYYMGHDSSIHDSFIRDTTRHNVLCCTLQHTATHCNTLQHTAVTATQRVVSRMNGGGHTWEEMTYYMGHDSSIHDPFIRDTTHDLPQCMLLPKRFLRSHWARWDRYHIRHVIYELFLLQHTATHCNTLPWPRTGNTQGMSRMNV